MPKITYLGPDELSAEILLAPGRAMRFPRDREVEVDAVVAEAVRRQREDGEFVIATEEEMAGEPGEGINMSEAKPAVPPTRPRARK